MTDKITDDLAAALRNLRSLARPHFSDETQTMALIDASNALAAYDAARRECDHPEPEREFVLAERCGGCGEIARVAAPAQDHAELVERLIAGAKSCEPTEDYPFKSDNLLVLAKTMREAAAALSAGQESSNG